MLDASRRFSPIPVGELSVVVLDDAAMRRLHADFLNDPAGTDVITFEGDAIAGTAGEICVCADVARDYARAHGRDFCTELTLYVVHGYLHLAGFDDTTPGARRRMRAAERAAMETLVATGALLQGTFRPVAPRSRSGA